MIELIVGMVFLTLTSLFATAQSHLEREEDIRAGSLSLARVLAIVVFASFLMVYSEQKLLGAFGLLVLWFLQQLAGKLFGSRFGESTAKSLAPFVNAFDKLVRPIRLHVPDVVEEYEQELIESVEDFSETVVREVMVPRVDMEVVDGDASLQAALTVFVATGYSRLPVIGDGVDDVVGVLYLKDLARITHQDPALLSSTKASEAARKPLFTPESKPVAELLQQMQAAKTQIAIVSDEYGGVAGIATVEDLIEELVGEIVDEYDQEDAEIDLIASDLYRVSPRVTLDELSEHCEIEVEDEDVDTVGGLLIKALGQLPTGGEIVSVGPLELTAERVDIKRGRVLSVLVRKIEVE